MEYVESSADEYLSTNDFKIKKNTRDDLFIKELNNLPFTEEIKNEAFNVYKNMQSSIKRKNNRKGLKFFCIYNAHLNLNKIKDVNHIAKICELELTELNKIFKVFSFEKTGYRMKDVDISPMDYIEDYYTATELRRDEIDGVIQFAHELLKKNSLSDEYPQVVAAAIIIYYMWKIHNTVPPIKFIKYVGRSESMINKVLDKIGNIYNT